MAAWLIPLLINLAVSTVSYLIMPKPKQAKPDGAAQLETPTADAGKPMAVVFGTMTVKELNVLYYTDKSQSDFKVAA